MNQIQLHKIGEILRQEVKLRNLSGTLIHVRSREKHCNFIMNPMLFYTSYFFNVLFTCSQFDCVMHLKNCQIKVLSCSRNSVLYGFCTYCL